MHLPAHLDAFSDQISQLPLRATPAHAGNAVEDPHDLRSPSPLPERGGRRGGHIGQSRPTADSEEETQRPQARIGVLTVARALLLKRYYRWQAESSALLRS